MTLRAREIGVAEATPVCTEGLLLWRYHPVPETGRTTQTGHPDLDALSPPPRERFIVMRKGETREWDAELRLYDEPAGRYAVSLSRFYVHDGWTHGLDAWTGVVNATRPVVIEIRP